ncbi:MAG: tetratricopeptide repeat protein [Verrucomicrobia bacterium]|nr:tetratricopeptide repeat protein [Verrucomicrobiota bacterium]
MERSPHFERALLLHEQGRSELAEKELRQHLASSPQDGIAHALLGITLLSQERRDEAEAAAKEAIGNAPDAAFTHYAMSRVLADRHRYAEAHSAIEQALQLEPTDADYHAMKSVILLNQRQWQSALDAAEAGLQFSPEHVECNNYRAMALVKLGRKSEAGQTIDSTLARSPEDSFSHANQGWTLLEGGRRQEAMMHFKESLRLDPTNDWARAGLVEALKAGNPVYAVMLRYFLWMAKLSDGARWGILIGGYFGNRLLAGVARSQPEWAPWILPVRILYITFALLTWLAAPLFNLMLFLHPLGKHALDQDQKSQARLVGSCIGLALVSLGLWLAQSREGPFLGSALVFGLLALPCSAIHTCSEGWPRSAMRSIALILGALGIGSLVIIIGLAPAKGSEREDLGMGLLGLFLLGSFLSQWAAIFLQSQQPRR